MITTFKQTTLNKIGKLQELKNLKTNNVVKYIFSTIYCN